MAVLQQQVFSFFGILFFLLSPVQCRIKIPLLSMNIGHKNVGQGIHINSTKGELMISTLVSDDFSIGANLRINESGESPLNSIFGRLSRKIGNGKAIADLAMQMNDSSVSGVVILSEGRNQVIANVDSRSQHKIDDIMFIRKSKYWSFRPTFHLATGKIDLEASSRCFRNTDVKIDVLANGNSSLEINHMFNDKTSIVVDCPGTNFKEARYELSRNIDAVNTIVPTFDMATKHVTVSWVRKLSPWFGIGIARSLSLHLDPASSVKIELSGNQKEDMKATLSCPWGGGINQTDITFSRRLRF